MTDENMNNGNSFPEDNIPENDSTGFAEAENPGQITPQPGYGDIDPSFNPGYDGGGPELPPKKSVWPKVLIGLAAVAVICIGVFFAMRGMGPSINGVSRSDAEAYLTEARLATDNNIMTDPDTGEVVDPEVTNKIFTEGAWQAGYSLELLGMPDAPEAEGVNFDISLKTDAATGHSLIEADGGYGGINVTGNKLYISEDFVALSVPDIYSSHEFISINPATFIDEWNASDLSEFYGPLPIMNIGGLFSASALGAYIDAINTQSENLTAHGESFYETGAFSDEGDEEINVRGKAMTAAKLSYTMDPAQAKEFYLGASGIVEEMAVAYFDYLETVTSGITDAIGEDPYADMAASVADVFSEIEKIEFPDGLKLTFYVGEETGLINRVIMEEARISNPQYPGEDVTFTLSCDMAGEEYLMDDMGLELNLGNADQAFDISFTNITERGETLKDAMTFDFSADGYGMSAAFNIDWDEDAAEDNFKSDMDITLTDVEETNIKINMDGTLIEDGTAVSLTDCLMDMTMDGEPMMSANVGFNFKEIDPAEVEIDRSLAVDFFTLDFQELTQEIMAGAMSLMY